MAAETAGPVTVAEEDESLVRCSEWSRQNDVDPVGTAGSYSGFLLVEWPLPWPRDVSEIPALSELAVAARRASVRLQAVLGSPEAERSVAFYRWDSAAGSYVGYEAPAGTDAALTARRLLDGGNPPGMHPIDTVDVLVCGHGRRDRCCGSLGTALEVEIRASGRLSGRYRVRRTTHTGGHRFAPTAVVLPEGTCWAYLDVDSLVAILDHGGYPRDLLGHYRGATGLETPGVQALEREVLGEIGWELLGWPRWGSLQEGDLVRLEVDPPDGAPRVWEARVVTRRALNPPPCGAARTGNEKPDREIAVEDVREVPAAATSGRKSRFSLR